MELWTQELEKNCKARCKGKGRSEVWLFYQARGPDKTKRFGRGQIMIFDAKARPNLWRKHFDTIFGARTKLLRLMKILTVSLRFFNSVFLSNFTYIYCPLIYRVFHSWRPNPTSRCSYDHHVSVPLGTIPATLSFPVVCWIAPLRLRASLTSAASITSCSTLKMQLQHCAPHLFHMWAKATSSTWSSSRTKCLTWGCRLMHFPAHKLLLRWNYQSWKMSIGPCALYRF